jgi:hypothetical protein
VIGFHDYISFAERHLEMAEVEIDAGKDANLFLIPSVILAWSAIESFVNNILDIFDSLPANLFEAHEKAFLMEKHLKFQESGKNAGQFAIKGNAFKKLSDKILFLIVKCGSEVKLNDTPWKDFERLKDIRDALVHPRQTKHKVLDADITRDCINISKRVIVFISEGLGHKVDF